MNKAIDSLEINTEEPSNPGEGNGSGSGSGEGTGTDNGSGTGTGTGSDSGNGTGSQENGSTTNDETPNTGAESNAAGYGILSIVTLGGLFGLLKSRKKEEKSSK